MVKKKKAPSPAELAKQAATAKTLEQVSTLAKTLQAGTEEAKVEAAHAFRFGGTLASDGIHDIAASSWPLVEAGIAPLVAVLARRGADAEKDRLVQPARAAATEALHDLAVQATNVLLAGQNPISDAIVAAGGVKPLIRIAQDGEAVAPVREHPMPSPARYTPSVEAEHASELLCCLALTAAHRVAIVEAGGHETLLRLAREGTCAALPARPPPARPAPWRPARTLSHRPSTLHRLCRQLRRRVSAAPSRWAVWPSIRERHAH